MAQDVDLSSKEWTDIVFEGKNKEFGAYTLRNDSPKRHTNAVLIVLGVIAALVVALILSISGVFDTPEEETDAESYATAADLGDESDLEEDEITQEFEEEEIPEPEEVQEIEETTATQALTELNLLDKEEIKEENKIDLNQVAQNTEVIGNQNIEGTEDLNRDAAKKEVVEEKPKEVEKPKHEAPVNLAMVEQKPQFPGGDGAMYKWLGENINYPAQASEEGVQGKVTVQFVVEKDGSISNVTVARGKHPALDAEAVRVIKKMPRWTPGRNNGQPVRVTYLLPVTFRLQ